MIQNEESEQKEPPSVEVNGQKKLSESDFISKSLKASFKQKSFLGEGDEVKTKTDLEFHHVTLTLTTPGKREKMFGKRSPPTVRKILDNVSGELKASCLTGIMGPSGSGKTSLLNILAGRLLKEKKLHLTGSILNNKVKITNWSHHRRICSYIEQDDLLFHNLTVLETIRFYAHLRLPSTFSYEEREERVNAVVLELSLNKCLNTKIGNAKNRGVSGGERKRVSIAIEILKGPNVIFLDEPTSGLDSNKSLQVITTIKQLALTGRTIVTSIHQPRSAIWGLFDDVIILTEGRIVYKGRADKMIEFLNGLEIKMPLNYNPADFIIDVVSIDARDEALEREAKERVKNLDVAITKVYEERDAAFDANKKQLASEKSFHVHYNDRYEAPYARQLYYLLKRALVQKKRDAGSTKVPFIMNTFFGFVLGFIYFETGSNLSQNAIQDKLGLIFFITLNQGFQGMTSQVTNAPLERDIVNRERAAKTYNVSAYFISKVLADMPSFFFPFYFVVVCYNLALFKQNASSFFEFSSIVVLNYWVCGGWALILAMGTGSQAVAQALQLPLMLIFILFSGFYANTSLIPVWLRWLQWISPMRYTYSALVLNQFTGLNFTCSGAEPTGCIPNGAAVIARLGFQDDTIVNDAVILLGMGFLTFLISFTCLRVKKRSFMHFDEKAE